MEWEKPRDRRDNYLRFWLLSSHVEIVLLGARDRNYPCRGDFRSECSYSYIKEEGNVENEGTSIRENS